MSCSREASIAMPLANVEVAWPSGRLDAAKEKTYSPAALAEPITGG